MTGPAWSAVPKMPPMDAFETEEFTATIDLLHRTGAKEFTLRFQDDEEPTIWCASVSYPDGAAEAAGALHPHTAVKRLAAHVIDGGHCTRCRRTTAFCEDWRTEAALTAELVDAVCWRTWDPELHRFRRSCE